MKQIARLSGISAALLLSLTVAADQAHAKCAGPSATIAPLSGATLPPNPTVYVFVPHSSEVEVRVTAGKRVIPAKVSLASTGSDAFQAFRVSFSAGGAKRVKVAYNAEYRSGVATYRIDPDWTRPEPERTGVLGTSYAKSQWTCSFTDEYTLKLAPSAPAYRVIWSSASEPPTDVDQHTAVFPHHMDQFWSYRRSHRKAANQPGQIAFGHVNCFGWTVPESAFQRGIYLTEITALYPDGSERAVIDEPLRVGPKTPNPPPEPAEPPVADQVDEANHLAPQALLPVVEIHRAAPENTACMTASLLGCAALCVLLGFVWTRRRLHGAHIDALARIDALSLPQIAVVTSAFGLVGIAIKLGGIAAATACGALVWLPAAVVASVTLGAGLAMGSRCRRSR